MNVPKITHCEYTNTIRLRPYNYLIAYNRDGRWLMEPDLSCPHKYVLLVTQVLMTHACKYGKGDYVIQWCNGLIKILESDMGNNYFKN